MSRPSPIFFLALVAIVWTASSGAAISVSLNQQPQEVSPRWFLQRMDSVLNPDSDIEPPVILNPHVSPENMKQCDPNVPRVEISAWVRDDVWVDTVYAEVGGRYIPLIDLSRNGRYEGHCSSNLPPGDHEITIVAVDRAGNAARCDDLVLRILDPLDLNSNRIEDCLEKLDDQDLRVIVLHEENVSLKKEDSKVQEKVEEEFRVLPGTSMVVSRSELENLAKTEGVKGVYEDKKLMILGEVSEGYSPRTDPRFSVDDYVGRGMTVAILDTGADPNHQSLDDMDDDIFTDDPKIVAFKDFVNGREEIYDDHGHGTHCASLIAGTGDQGGVAPGARLVVIKVMDKDGACYMSDAITALDWCLENQADLGIDVISFSVGGEGPSDGSTPLDAACNNMVDEGIVMCVGAGNAGPAARSIVTPGTAEKVITIGAIDADRSIYQRSSRGPTPGNIYKPDLVAVGVNVTSARSGTLREKSTMSGTSMATPQVAGAAAVILEKQRNLDPDEVKRVLIKSADDLGLSIIPDNTYGYGALNLSEALSLVERSEPNITSLWLGKSEAKVGERIYVHATISGYTTDVERIIVEMQVNRRINGEAKDITYRMHEEDERGLYLWPLETRDWDRGNYTIQVELKDQFGRADTAASAFVLA